MTNQAAKPVIDQAISVVRGLWALFATGSPNLEAERELISAACLDHDPLDDRTEPDLAAQWFAPLRTLSPEITDAFPDMHSSFDDLVAEGDRVVVRGSERGTFRNPFHGEPPNGRPVRVTVINIFRVADGQIVERWGSLDVTPLMEALGMPTPKE